MNVCLICEASLSHHTLCVGNSVWILTNQSEGDWHHTPDSRTLEVFRVSPKREFVYFLFGFIQQKFNFFLHFESEIDTGIYEWE